MEDLKYIGSNLKFLRNKCFLTEKQVADFIGFDEEFIFGIERGEKNFNIDVLDALCNLFGVSTEDITSNKLDEKKLCVSFRMSNLEDKDLLAVSRVNKVALNLIKMQSLLDRK